MWPNGVMLNDEVIADARRLRKDAQENRRMTQTIDAQLAKYVQTVFTGPTKLASPTTESRLSPVAGGSGMSLDAFRRRWFRRSTWPKKQTP